MNRNTQRKYNRWQVVINNLQESVVTDPHRTSVKRMTSSSAYSSQSTVTKPDIYARPMRKTEFCSKNDVNKEKNKTPPGGSGAKKVVTMALPGNINSPPALPPKDFVYGGMRREKDYSLMMVNLEASNDNNKYKDGDTAPYDDNDVWYARQLHAHHHSNKQIADRELTKQSLQTIVDRAPPPLQLSLGQCRDKVQFRCCQPGLELRTPTHQVKRPASSYWDVLAAASTKSPVNTSPAVQTSQQPLVSPTMAATMTMAQETVVKKTCSAPDLLEMVDEQTSEAVEKELQCHNCGRQA